MADNPLDRRGFFAQGLRQLVSKAAEVVGQRMSGGEHIRPPGAITESAFLAACTRCGECEKACPVQAIHPLGTEYGFAAGTPALRIDVQACAMCVDIACARSCPTPALEVPDSWRDVRIARISIDADRCVTWRGVSCGVCARVCPAGEDALRIDADGHPVLGAACTGCGSCINACITSPSSILHSLLGSNR
jgi:ferredoxin-type protein NapG